MYYTNIIYILDFFHRWRKKDYKEIMQKKKYFSGSRQGSSKRAQTNQLQ